MTHLLNPHSLNQMTYYLLTDTGTQWFHYLVSKDGETFKEVFDMRDLNHLQSTLLANIYDRELMDRNLPVTDYRIVMGCGGFYGWTISYLEFSRIKRLLELSPAIQEFNKLKDSV